MKRNELLKFIKKHLEKLGAELPIHEVYIYSGNLSEVHVGRTLLIEGAPSETDIVNLFHKFHKVLIEGNCISRYDTFDSILDSKLISQNARELSLNWRGRFYKWEDLISCKNKEEFDEKVLASYWRLIITKKDDDYFTRHEISPTYYNPGHSTGGLKDFKDGIESFLKYLFRLREQWQLDPKFDRIVIFARLEPTKNFTRCLPAFFNGKNYISFEDLQKEIDSSSKSNIIDQIYTSIKNITG